MPSSAEVSGPEIQADAFELVGGVLRDPLALLEAVRDDQGAVVDFRYVYANAAANARSQGGLSGRTVCEAAPVEVRAELVEACTRALAGAEPQSAQMGHGWASGAVTWAVVDCVRVSEERVSCSWRDVTMEQRVVERVAHWSAVFDRATWGVALITDGKHLGVVNAAYAQMLGCAVADLEGASWQASFTPEAWSAVPAQLDAARRDGGTKFESEHVRTDLSIFPVEVNVTIAMAEDGRELYRTVQVEDISERKRAEREAAEREERYAAAVGSMLDAFAVMRAVRDESGSIVDFRFDYVNDAACVTNRLSRAELVGRRLREIRPGHDALGVFERYVSVVETGAPVRIDNIIYQLADEQHPWGVFDMQCVRLGDGISVSYRDVSERYRAERELADRGEMFSAAVGSMLDGFVILQAVRDQDDRIVDFLLAFANDAACAAHRRGRDELVDHRLGEIGPGPLGMFERYVDVVERAQPLDIAGAVSDQTQEDGTRALRTFDLRVVPLGDGVTITFRDVTERVAEEERVRSLLEAAPDAIFRLSPTGVIEVVNEAAERAFGYERSELVGQPFDLLIPHLAQGIDVVPGDAHRSDPHPAPLGAAGSGAHPGQKDLVGVRRDGSEFPIETSVAQIVSQTRPGTTAIVRDVTDRRRSQDQLEQWRELFEHAAWGVVAGPVPSSPEQAAEQKLDLMNPTFAQMHGYTREELAGKPFRSVFSDAAWEEMPGHIARAHQQGSYSFESEHVRADGSTFPVHTNVTLIRGPHGDVRYRVAHVEDITRRKATEEALRQAEQRFRTAFDRAPAGMALISTSEHDYGRVLRVNEALCEITGRDRETLLAITMTDIAEPDDPSAQAAVLAAIAAGEQADHFDAKIMRPDGQVCEVAIRCSAVPESGEQAYFIEHVVDISQRRRFEEQLKRLADHDPLTGLFNRRRFGEELTRHLRLAGRHRPSGAVMLIDLDNFKYVNDTLGHQAGDRILHDAAQLLKARLRASDTVARLGGDEFVALLPDADAEAALTIARALGEIFEASQLGGHTRTGTRLTLSIGVKTIDRQACQLPWEKLLAEADIALYEAKEQGRNQTVLSGTDIEGRARMQQRLEWSERLRTALELDSLTLYAQPIIALQHGGALTSYELLVRLIDADGTVHGPEQFLPIARRFGLSRRLDRQVITKAMRLAARSPGGGQLAINLSADSTSDPELPDFITRHVHALGIDPSRLIFEITETAAIENLEHAAALAERLHDLGCLLALDDFGVGFGSFHYLKHIPIDFVKIDGGFIRELCDHPGDQVMVKAMVHAAQGLGKKTIAEWVSDERTKRRLTGYGVDYVQGYHIGPPQPATELILQPPRGKANRRRRAGA